MSIRSEWYRPLLLLACLGGCNDGGSPDSTFGVCDHIDCDDSPSEAPGDTTGAPQDDEASDGSGTSGDSGDSASGSGLPCAVRDALVAECGLCHGPQPKFGAPMPLTSYDDLMVPAASDVTRPVLDVVAQRLVDPVRPMPPNGEISEDAKSVLLEWIAAGAPLDPDANCEESGPDSDPEGPGELDCEPDIVLTAHAPDSDDGFAVPAVGADDLYQCFAFPVPQTQTGQAVALAPIVDDERVVHHWILYRQPTQPAADTFPCDASLQVSATFVSGWAPGGGNQQMPAEVGLELGEPGEWYVLQIHYNNVAQYDDVVDSSGVAICTAQEPRPKTAGIITIGTIGINIPAGAHGHQESGTCGALTTSFWPEPLHVLSGSPHMHALGRGFHSVVNHKDGNTEVLTAVPVFDWQNQKTWENDPEVIIDPGDSITSTCTFDNPGADAVAFGEGSGQEMCFNFLLAYPVDGVTDRNCGIIF